MLFRQCTKLFIFFGLVSLPWITQANGIFAGYDEFCGLPIVVKPTDQAALAWYEDGEPMIIIDPKVAKNLTKTQRFLIAHECGHHYLGHANETNVRLDPRPQRIAEEEMDADCFAAQQLIIYGDLREISNAIFTFSQDRRSKHPYPDDPARARKIKDCAESYIDELPPSDDNNVEDRFFRYHGYYPPRKYKCEIERSYNVKEGLPSEYRMLQRRLGLLYHQWLYLLKSKDRNYEYCGRVKINIVQTSLCSVDVNVDIRQSSDHGWFKFSHLYDFQKGVDWTKGDFFDSSGFEDIKKILIKRGHPEGSEVFKRTKWLYNHSGKDSIAVYGAGFYIQKENSDDRKGHEIFRGDRFEPERFRDILSKFTQFCTK